MSNNSIIEIFGPTVAIKVYQEHRYNNEEFLKEIVWRLPLPQITILWPGFSVPIKTAIFSSIISPDFKERRRDKNTLVNLLSVFKSSCEIDIAWGSLIFEQILEKVCEIDKSGNTISNTALSLATESAKFPHLYYAVRYASNLKRNQFDEDLFDILKQEPIEVICKTCDLLRFYKISEMKDLFEFIADSCLRIGDEEWQKIAQMKLSVDFNQTILYPHIFTISFSF